MWGNIAVEETIDIRHVGAKLKGSFSRLDFQRENSGVSAVKSFKTVLPASGQWCLEHLFIFNQLLTEQVGQNYG